MREHVLLVCLHCTRDDDDGDPLVMPFVSTAERRRWWTAHSVETGHTWSWRSHGERCPHPHEAAAQALAWMAEYQQLAPRRKKASGAACEPHRFLDDLERER